MTWASVPLAEIATIERISVLPSDIETGSRYVGLEHIESGGNALSFGTVVSGELASNKFRFGPQHILFGKLRPYLAKIVCPDFEGICSTDILPIAPHSHIDQRYLLHFLKRPETVAWASSRATGVNLPRLSPNELASLLIPLPPLDEQRRIAAILDRADAVRRRRKHALALLDSLTQSIFWRMFGDPVSNPKRFPLKVLGEIGKLDRGVSKHRPRNAPMLLGGPYPLIQTGDVANSGGYIRSYSSTYSEAGLRQSKIWPAGTLCITIAANIAETGILTFPACFPDSVVGFTHEQPAMAQFLRVWLSFLRSTLERAAPTVAQKNINLQILRDLKVALPPEGLIAAFGAALEAQLTTENRLRSALAKGQLLFGALQHQTLSGEMG